MRLAVVIVAVSLFMAACAMGFNYSPSTHEMHACERACNHFAGEVGRRHMQTSWPMTDQRCMCRFDDGDTEVCARRRRFDDPTPVCE